MKGARIFPHPDIIVINTNSPETFQLTIESGSTCPKLAAISPPAPPAKQADITYLICIAF